MFLDMSHTLHYFTGSSIESDLAFVARRLDRRVLFGSDLPECSIPEAVRAAVRLTDSLSEESRGRIFGKTWFSILNGISAT
jgi:predicted TIM-barrel fold metal-dependent hydrolase